MQILVDSTKSNELTIDKEDVLKVCDAVIKIMEEMLPQEAHRMEVYEYVLMESKKRLYRQVISIKEIKEDEFQEVIRHEISKTSNDYIRT